MALHGVFANDLRFGKDVDSDQAQDNERKEKSEGDTDLEEGEIADDDEPQQHEIVEEVKDDAKPVTQKGDKKEESKLGNANKSEKSDNSNFKNSDVNAEKRRDKRMLSNSRLRKRADDDAPEHRDSHRKRRRIREEENEEIEDMDYDTMNARGYSPVERTQRYGGIESAGSDYDDNNTNLVRRHRGGETRSRTGRNSPLRRRPVSGSSRDRGAGDRRRQERDRLERDRRLAKSNLATSASSSKMKEESICAFYMEGKCSRGTDCPYSHAALPPRKMELCKFYLMDCCAKKEKCLYLHKDFPCKFFHTGKKCRHSADDCKFSHESLSETMRAILIKHIETAPREILGDFPRLTREETIQAIENFSALPNGRDKRPHIPALFDKTTSTSSGLNKVDAKDHSKIIQLHAADGSDDCATIGRVGFYQDVGPSETLGRGEQPEENSRSIWFNHLGKELTSERVGDNNLTEENLKAETMPTLLPNVTNEEEKKNVDYFSMLPARQRQLYRRIQQQQREPHSSHGEIDSSKEENLADEKWYSSDEEGNGESITNILKNIKHKPEVHSELGSSPSALQNLNLSSLENINVAEIAKALSSLQQNQTSSVDTGTSTSETNRRDPRSRDPRMRSSQPHPVLSMGDVDLRVPASSRQDIDLRLDSRMAVDVDLRSGMMPLGSMDDVGSSDVDLRRFALPFHTQAQEIEASFASRPPMEYQVWLVDITPLDYSQIRVQADWAHLDPRQQKAIACTRDFTSTDTPAIPLGPASPDPTPATHIRHYEPEVTSYSPLQTAPNDPRARDPRRVSSLQSQQSSLFLEKRSVSGIGLLGAAPPGMLPLISKGNAMDTTQDASYANFRSSTSYVERTAVDEVVKEQQTRHLENRRDPRQRHKTQPSMSDPTERDHTRNERIFR